ncbi:hypothetical protein PSTT_06482 [Puccinia striiformis]|uniref:beta-galactosidase n=1 Tax=Puccinia striiformis TaxID=27350 RepID=A0A2S4VK75_9BASI|nr:hypothetical protein PSTT_06482 [Puccinia striiformis]
MKLRFHSLLTLSLGVVQTQFRIAAPPSLGASDSESPSVVSWDRHSMLIEGERVFIQSGEFHTWRLPVVSQWTDILQKFSAAGLNTVSIYGKGLVNPINGTTDWQGFKSLQPLFDAARSAGLFVIVRPGPYINAETTDRLTKWYGHCVQVENEYMTDAHSSLGQPSGKDQYMQDLADALLDKGIVVPLTVNDAGMYRNFATGMGAMDIYGFDSYPQSFDCSKPNQWKPVVETYKKYQDSLHLKSPLFIPEFQAGAYDSWGATGYENCRKLTGPEFESVFYLNNLAANIKMINYYVSRYVIWWNKLGQLAFPGTYTSYDYGSAISEDRTLNEKYTELKRQSLFLRSSKEFYETEVVGDSKHDPNYFEAGDKNSAVVTELRNPTSGAGFYIVRALNSTSIKPTNFTLNVLTSVGLKQLPQITLLPRESRLLVTDYRTSPKSDGPGVPHPIQLLYTTSSVLLSAHIGGHQVLYLFSNSDGRESQASGDAETSSIKIPDLERGYFTKSFPETGQPPSFQISAGDDSHGYREINWRVRDEGSIFALGSQSSVVLITSKAMAGEVWNPILAQSDPSKPSSSVLIWGPWLVRNASISITDNTQRKILRIWGDFEEGSKKEVLIFVGGLSIGEVEWNGKTVENLARAPESSFLSFIYHPNSFKTYMQNKSNNQLTHVGSRIDFRTLKWRYQDSLPEIKTGFSDDQWTEATIEKSNNHYKKLYGKYYLYACDYGFCNGATIWRGHFLQKCQSSFQDQHEAHPNAQVDSPMGINLTIAGGDFFAASVWLNDIFSEAFRMSSPNRTPRHFIFLLAHSKNAKLTSSQLSKIRWGWIKLRMLNTPEGSWAINSKVKALRAALKKSPGRYKDILAVFTNPERGIYNENGFYGMRSGWHLPDYVDEPDNLNWKKLSPIEDGLKTAGIGFYSTTLNLDFEQGYDVIVSFQFQQPSVDEGRYRVEFWINGWHMGKFVSHLGPQTRFPVHQGILNYQADNHIALTLWALDDEGAKISGLELVVDKILEGGIGPIENHHPPYDSSRRHL